MSFYFTYLLLAQILTHHDPVYIAVNCTQYGIARYIADHVDDYKRHVEVRSQTVVVGLLTLVAPQENGTLMKENWARLKKLLKEELDWVYYTSVCC